MEKKETLPLGVVIERRRIDHPWKDHVWRPVGVIPGAPPLDPGGSWTLLRKGDNFVQYHAGTLQLELFRSDTEGYKVNLSQEPPSVYVVLRSNQDPALEHEFVPFLVTADPYEAQNYLNSGEEVVEPVAMPAEVLALVKDFVEAHHVDQVFVKRRRKDPKGEADSFSRRSARRRGGSAGGES